MDRVISVFQTFVSVQQLLITATGPALGFGTTKMSEITTLDLMGFPQCCRKTDKRYVMFRVFPL